MSIFVIEEAWSDPMENESRAAFGYSAVGYVDSKEEADAAVAAGGKVDKKFSWVLGCSGRDGVEVPRIRYKELKPFVPK